MLFWLGQHYSGDFGPARLLTSRLFLGGLGASLCFVATFVLLPRLTHVAAVDRGKVHAVEGAHAAGKPTGTGVIFIPIFVLAQLVCLPFTGQSLAVLGLMLVAMVFGYLDDRATTPWGDYVKGALDFVLAAGAATVLSQFHTMSIWLPFLKNEIELVWWLYALGGTLLIWLAINTVNCTDGVDGLSATLTLLAFATLGAVLYLVLGNERVAGYLLLPTAPRGAIWGMLAFSMCGVLLAYLWFNAHPSTLLMGDAGSRAVGFLLGVLVLTTRNPFMLLIVSGVLLVNGGTGLVKVALLRFWKISIFRRTRFPLHDHVRHSAMWSNTQVVMRFAIAQLMLTSALLLALFKLR